MARAAAAVATLFVFAFVVHFTAAASMKKDLSRATLNKTLELAHALQRDLRKNNDDYRDGPPPPRNPYLNGAAPGPPGNAPGPARRTAGPPRSAPGARNATGASDGATNTVSVSVPARRNQGNKSKVQQLLDQKGLLTKFLQGLGDAGKSQHEKKLRAFDSEEYFRPPPENLPEAELDMIAASGQRIDTLKRRGRLCHRHILFPEGPKYDSRGKVYLNPHALKVDFASTRRPRLLLPRCCNCCKKSVLGCE